MRTLVKRRGDLKRLITFFEKIATRKSTKTSKMKRRARMEVRTMPIFE